MTYKFSILKDLISDRLIIGTYNPVNKLQPFPSEELIFLLLFKFYQIACAYLFQNSVLHCMFQQLTFTKNKFVFRKKCQISAFCSHIFIAALNSLCFHAILKLIFKTSFSQISKLLFTRKYILVLMLWPRQASFHFYAVHIELRSDYHTRKNMKMELVIVIKIRKYIFYLFQLVCGPLISFQWILRPWNSLTLM